MIKQTIALDPRRRRHALPACLRACRAPPWPATDNQSPRQDHPYRKSRKMRKIRELSRPDRAIQHEKLENSAPHHEDTVRFSSCMRQSGMEEGSSLTQRGFDRMGGAGGWLGWMDRRHDKWRRRPIMAAARRRGERMARHPPWSVIVQQAAISIHEGTETPTQLTFQ